MCYLRRYRQEYMAFWQARGRQQIRPEDHCLASGGLRGNGIGGETTKDEK